MQYLNFDVEQLERMGGLNTAREISRQPDLWMQTYHKLLGEKNTLLAFLENVFGKECPYIILTGAGTSAFIGEALAGTFQKKWGICTRPIATTDIITHPEDYFIRSRPTLLISFARSGDSPESLATVDLADRYCDEIYKLHITCNKDGELARHAGRNTYVFLLPEETNDRSLAMTSSFTSMLLAGLLLLDIRILETMEPVVAKLREAGNFILNNHTEHIQALAATSFQRMVFLGSGPIFGTAHESHLKVQELSNGQVICTYDSFLGFRHGPRAVVNKNTVIAYLLSNNELSRKYEFDLIKSIASTQEDVVSIAIGNNFEDCDLHITLPILLPDEMFGLPETYLCVFYVMPAQMIGFFKSVSLGLSPDSPSMNGSISRVVQGVTIYD
jgi:tagatose-6-phosphate ketose/aldose isomerase